MIRESNPVLILGGAGFIGTNLADSLCSDGKSVIVYDNLARPGSEKNLVWLSNRHRTLMQFRHNDILDIPELSKAVRDASSIYHLAAQVAVTTSCHNPQHDFNVNLLGTYNLLEILRKEKLANPLVYASTNKVYGSLDRINLRCTDDRYFPLKKRLLHYGIDETQPLDFRTPYACSKGAGDQYTLDYARSFGVRSTVLRLGCVYGFRQHGNPDQGWISHFITSAIHGVPVKVFGNGKQVRDILFITDLVRALRLAVENIDSLQGKPFNVGGGASNSVSLIEVIKIIDSLHVKPCDINFENSRANDQNYYVSDTRKFSARTGWLQQVAATEGIHMLFDWMRSDISP